MRQSALQGQGGGLDPLHLAFFWKRTAMIQFLSLPQSSAFQPEYAARIFKTCNTWPFNEGH